MTNEQTVPIWIARWCKQHGVPAGQAAVIAEAVRRNNEKPRPFLRPGFATRTEKERG